MPKGRIARQNIVQRQKPAKKAKSRSLDAFAFAEQEVPVEAKIHKNRLRDLDDGDAAPEQHPEDGPSTKRLKITHESSPDSVSEDGGVGDETDLRIGEVESDDDSSLNSDEAFGEGDDERFQGFTFRGSSDAKPRPPDNEAHRLKSEANGWSRDRDAGHGDDFSNAQNHAELSKDPAEFRSSRTKRLSVEDDVLHDDETQGSDCSQDEEDSVLSMSDIDDGTEDPDKLSRLRDLATSLTKEDGPSSSAQHQFDSAQEAITPSEYGIRPRQKLSIADLLPSVTIPQGRKALRMMIHDGKKSKGPTQGMPGRLDVPLAKRKQDRLDRAAAYERSKETLSRWINTVKYNRRAEHLVFPLPNVDESSAKNTNRLPPTTLSKPANDLEGTIQSILVESGMAVATGRSPDDQIQDFEHLAANRLPLEEIQARRAELRRNRELLFREEIRAKRIKKIKSKSYRRVHRKERERNLLREKDALAAAGITPGDDQERLDRVRAEERMSGRHRDSKWAKSMKGIGRQAWDSEARGELTEMARKNEELRKRIQGQEIQDGDESIESSSTAEGYSDDETPEEGSRGLLDQLAKLKNGDADADTGHLGSLKFMQKANAAERARNDDTIEDLRRELAGEDDLSGGASEKEMPGRRRYGHKPSDDRPSSVKPRLAYEFEEHQGSHEDIGTDDEAEAIGKVVAEKSSPAQRPKPRGLEPSKKPSSEQQARKPRPAHQDNPWIFHSKGAKQSRSLAAEDTVLVLNRAVTARGVLGEGATLESSQPLSPDERQASRPDSLRPRPPENLQAPTTEASDSDSSSSFGGFSLPGSPRIPNVSHAQTNQELIRRAFASDDVFAASSFAAEKAALELGDRENQESATEGSSGNLPGWGSWTGAGLSKRDRKRSAATASTEAGELSKNGSQREAKDQQLRQDSGLANVMVSQKRVPKTARYLATALPRPFETKAQYERSLRLPVGREWVAGETFREMVRPRVETKAGEVVRAMSRPML